jgi:hypothetical protein
MIGGFLAGIIRAAPPEARRIVAIEILLWISAITSGECDWGFVCLFCWEPWFGCERQTAS